LKPAIELVSAGAVLVGLIFVAFELRQNTSAVQAASFQNYTDGALAWNFEVTASADLAEVFTRYLAGSLDLSDAERLRAELLVRSQWYRFQNAFSQWERDALSAEDWEVARKLICVDPGAVSGVTNRGAQVRRNTWSQNKPYMNQSFIDFVEGNECWGIGTN
jgi:hypothetical protein